MSMLKKIAVIGSGSWATAIVKILGESSQVSLINWWMRNPEYVEHFSKYGHNPNYLSSVFLDKSRIKANNNLEDSIKQSDIVIIATPSAFVHQVLGELTPEIFSHKIIISAVKGLIPETHQIVSDYFHTQLKVSPNQIACVSGPCHAEEVERERLSYLTIASENKDLAEQLVPLFSCRYINCISSDDITGIEYAAVLKNIYAIAAGIANGLGYGDNFKAVLISCAIREMELFLQKLGIESTNVNNSAYLGDLLVTAYSQLSRNRNFGNMLGREYSVASAQMEMKMIAEGYYSTKQIYILNQKVDANMPIMTTVYQIIYEGANCKNAFINLSKLLN
ncbi:MAG: NAD(P)H-dependent glycerol-3-phosphate dehydrogenase [Bacteroidia bacterium]|nr:NAD(P)H-dependent glycerol-3-phosphate dehydrogenase [Bacteroidia bacterium]